MADTKMGNYSQSSSASPNAPVVNTNNPEGGFMSSAMDFFNKNKIIIIGIIVLIIVGLIAYKYFGTERFNGASKKSKGKNKALKQMSEESEHFSASQEEDEQELTEEFDDAGFDGAEEYNAVEDFEDNGDNGDNEDNEDNNVENFEGDQDGGNYQQNEQDDQDEQEYAEEE